MRTLILKSLNACNLRCAYCSLGNKDQGVFMSEDTMRSALHFFAAKAAAGNERFVQVIFHGGEPMLLPPEQYDHCIKDIVKSFPQLHFRFSMQTNGTLLTPGYIELFQVHDIHVGVSLDGSQSVHDGQRMDTNGNGTYAVVMEHIQVLLNHEVPVAALSVVTRPALEADLHYLDQLAALGVPLKINPLLVLGDASSHPELALKPGDYARYLIRVFQHMERSDLSLHISPISELLTALLCRVPPNGCLYEADCCRNFLCVDQTGTLYPCGRFADSHTNMLGTIETGIDPTGQAILDRLEARRTIAQPEACRTCQFEHFCHAGCNADGKNQGISSCSPCATCEDLKILLHFLRTDGLGSVKAQLLRERSRLQSKMGTISEAGHVI